MRKQSWKTNYKGQHFIGNDRNDLVEDLTEYIKDCDWRSSDKFKAALNDVASNLPQIASIGELARQFPGYKNILVDILETLREVKVINFDDYKPMPTIVQKLNLEG
jgi:hypothetical protein